jgi:hypothetical protein
MKSLPSVVTALLLVFSLLPGQVLGMVLCFRADGRVAVEAAHNGRCTSLAAPTTAHHHEPTAHLLPGEDFCSPCIDIVILARQTDDGPRMAAASALPTLKAPAVTGLSFFVPCAAGAPSTPFVLRSLVCPSTLVALRTVVLLL